MIAVGLLSACGGSAAAMAQRRRWLSSADDNAGNAGHSYLVRGGTPNAVRKVLSQYFQPLEPSARAETK